MVYFRKTLFGATKDYIKNFSSANLDKEFKSYLHSVIRDELIREHFDNNDKNIIIASILGDTSFCEYVGYNHNLKY